MDLGVELLGGIARKRSVSLHIIGEGLNLNEFVNRLEVLNVKVICHGVVFDMDEKNKVFAQCNMGLNIPREEIHSTMSLKAIEYMRAGLPFVNNAFGDIRMFVEKDNIGININKNNIAEAIDVISGLTSDNLTNMHENTILSYRNRFINQDIKSVLDI
jgi:glycosyltransferase involved in cell wall biosynthesis